VILVPDANALIYLAKADLLHEAFGDAPVHVGSHVYREAVEQGIEEGYADAFILDRFVDRECTRVSVDSDVDLQRVSQALGGTGEAEVLSLAENADGPATAITSDARAYRQLDRRGVDVARTDMLLFHRFEQGEMARQDLYEALLSLRQAHGTTDARMAFLMRQAEDPQ